MVYKLSISNIKKSFKDYTIYFVTLMLGVCIFYIFNSIDSQTAMNEVENEASQKVVIKHVVEVLSYVSVFVSIVLGYLVIYASRFFIKKRSKEFGIYMTLGMSKRSISYILFLETFIIGFMSLLLGLLIGIPLSQVTSVFVRKMFQLNMSKYTFEFSKSAVKKTTIYFAIIYIIVMIFNTIVINKNKLIDLMQKSKKQEKIKLKNPYISAVVFIISVGMLITTYYFWIKKPNLVLSNTYGANLLLITMVFLLVGTFLFFYSLAGIMLKILSKCHRIYCNNLNMFVFKQLSSKINTMVASMSIICLMLLGILCLIPVSLTVKKSLDESFKKIGDVDYQLIKPMNIENNKNTYNLDEFIDSSELFKNNIKDRIAVTTYTDGNLTYESVIKEYKKEINESFLSSVYTPMSIMSENDYNKMAKLCNFDTVTLNDYECAIVANNPSYTGCYEKIIKDNKSIKVFEKDLKPTKKVINGYRELFFSMEGDERGFVVVKDGLIKKDEKYIQNQMILGTYSTKNEKIVEEIEKYITDKNIEINTNNDDTTWVSVETKAYIKKDALGFSLNMTFMGMYLGIIFLISSAAILALKELADSIDDKDKYKTIRKIGADEKDINKALFKQSFIFFMLPLLLASIHTIAVLKLFYYLLDIKKISGGMIKTVGAAFAFLIVVYGIYFIITYVCSKNIIRRRTE